MTTIAVAKRAAMAALAGSWRKAGSSIGFVPTMGALHRGHAALIERARRENNRVVVSVFVNPAQFSPTEDYGRYPRAFTADKQLCAACGADVVYHPSVKEVYPDGFSTFVEVGPLGRLLDGKFRPGHFRGVATVVLKLFETVRPTRAYFGEKDYQQLAIIKRMSQDLDLQTLVVGCPTVREADGLALSSRNAYLSTAERAKAPRIHEALLLGERLAARASSGRKVEACVRRRILRTLPGARIDYVRLVDAETLEAVGLPKARLRLLAAVRLGKTRLIDNIPVSL